MVFLVVLFLCFLLAAIAAHCRAPVLVLLEARGMNGHYAPNATNNALAMAAIAMQMYVNFSSGGMGRFLFCCVVGLR